MDISSLSSGQRAAILLIALGEDAASAVISTMAPDEIEKLGRYMTEMSNASPALIDAVVSSFFEALGSTLNAP